NFGAKSVKEMENVFVDLASKERRNHILIGEGIDSGGHMFPGKAGKSVFPEQWSADKIMHEVSDIATDPSVVWVNQKGVQGALFTKKGDAARWVTDTVRDGVEIRVVIEPAGAGIITAFPRSGPGVIFNP
ncbi:MAG: hypothetical protein EOO45_11035, partial [Flavobacterium sp.]